MLTDIEAITTDIEVKKPDESGHTLSDQGVVDSVRKTLVYNGAEQLKELIEKNNFGEILNYLRQINEQNYNHIFGKDIFLGCFKIIESQHQWRFFNNFIECLNLFEGLGNDDFKKIMPGEYRDYYIDESHLALSILENLDVFSDLEDENITYLLEKSDFIKKIEKIKNGNCDKNYIKILNNLTRYKSAFDSYCEKYREKSNNSTFVDIDTLIALMSK